MKTHAIQFDRYGPPSVLKWRAVELAEPGQGEVLLRHDAAGFNYADVYRRTGLYKVSGFPSAIGFEGAGTIEAVGRGIEGFRVGDRVAYAGGGEGSYSEARLRDADGLIKLPGWLGTRIAAAALIKGCTVQYLFNRTHKLKKGETILFHAAAGGVGLIACQWARAVGARMIGTVSTDAKARLAKRHGCAEVIVTSRKDVADEVKRLTNGRGVDVVYDSIGHDLWQASLASVRPHGLVVLFGSASGKAPPMDLWEEGAKTASYFIRAKASNYLDDPADRLASARHLFRMIRSGAVEITIGQTYQMKDAAKAHRDAEARRTTGSTLLLP